MEYSKQTLVEPQKVSSDSLTKEDQAYKIIYLEKTKDYKDKVRIYFFDRPIDKCRPRSMSFYNPEQLLMFIQGCVKSYLFLKEERIRPELSIPLEIYRIDVMLSDLLKDIKKEQMEVWKNGGNKNIKRSN